MAVEFAHVAIIVGLLSIEVMEDMLSDVIVHYGDDIIEPKLITILVFVNMGSKHVEYAKQMSRVYAVKILYYQARPLFLVTFHIF